MILWKGTVKEDRGEETKVAAVEGFFFFLLAFESISNAPSSIFSSKAIFWLATVFLANHLAKAAPMHDPLYSWLATFSLIPTNYHSIFIHQLPFKI